MVYFKKNKDLLLWYDKPANVWEEALPVGNGRLGAMIFGNVVNERIQLNESSVWSGKYQPNADRQEGYKVLPEIRQLLRQDNYKEAMALSQKYIGLVLEKDG